MVLGVTLSFLSVAQQNPADSIFLSRPALVNDGIETIESVSLLDPNRAAMLSAVLPGLGQAYNNQHWKIPIIYGGAIILGHYINYNHRIYEEMRTALIAELDNNPGTVNPYGRRFPQSALSRNRDLFRRNRDFLMIISAAYYLLNVVDAHVSAHLHEFEVNDNLSMIIHPSIQPTPLFSQAVGISVTLTLK